MKGAAPRPRRPALAAVVALALGTLSSCGRSAGEPERTPLQVYAAASLSGVFPRLAAHFEQEHPGTSVALTFAGSSDLEAQLVAGAPGDVFASADEATMHRALRDGLASAPQRFASNRLVVVTSPGNPAGIRALSDLTRPDLDVVVCAPQVPCGAATQRALHAARVRLTPASEANAVTGVLGAVTSGQADAGVVYVTDARRAGDTVSAVPIPASAATVNHYPIAVLTRSTNPAARQFVDLVRSPAGQAMLHDAGFGR